MRDKEIYIDTKYICRSSYFDIRERRNSMKKRLAKVLALGLTAAMFSGAPLSAMAAEVNQPDVVSEIDDTGIATQELTDSAADPVINGVDPMSLNGVIQLNDGDWYYFEHGNFRQVTGLYSNSAGWWYVENGTVRFDYNGVYEYGGSDWYLLNSQVQFGYTGPAAYNNQIYYIRDGRVDYDFTGLVQATIKGESAWWYFENGKWSKYPSVELVEYNGAWWYLNDGKIDFSYTGTAWYNGVDWYVSGGRVDFNYTGRVDGYQEGPDDTKVPFQTYFVNGMQDVNLTGVYYTEVEGIYDWYGFYEGQLAAQSGYYSSQMGYVLSNANGWWYVDPKSGKVDFTYTGVAWNDYGTWYMSNGQIDFGYNGFYTEHIQKETFSYDNVYAISGGKNDSRYDGIVWADVNGVQGWYGFTNGYLAGNIALMKKDDGTWWYVGSDGMVDFTYAGKAFTEYGYYYVENGQINFGFTGAVKDYNNVYQYYQNGKKADWNYSGLVETSIDGEQGWYYVDQGYITHNHALDGQSDSEDQELVPNESGWWVVENGKVNFEYNGFFDNKVYDKYGHWYGTQGQWYIRNGQVDFSVNGMVKLEDYANVYAYVVNGYRDFKLNTVALGTINGETAWWSVDDGTVWGFDEGFAEYGGKVWYFSDGKVDFTKSGTYTDEYRDLFEFHTKCEVVNGQVISMTVEAI